MTKKKATPQRRGPKLSKDDRLRVQLADDLRSANPHLSLSTAMKTAMVMHPNNLGALSKVLASLPIPGPHLLKQKGFKFLTSKGLSGEDNASLTDETNRLIKALKVKAEASYFEADTSSIEGSPHYEKPDGAIFDDGFVKKR